MQKLFIDQWGNKFWAENITHLKKNEGISGKVFRIYCDGKDGKTYQTGWGIGSHWFQVFTPMREPA